MTEQPSIEALMAMACKNVKRLSQEAAADHAELSADPAFSDLAAPLAKCQDALHQLAERLHAPPAEHCLPRDRAHD